MHDASLFTDQSPDDLHLSLIEGELNVEPYNVLWSSTVDICGISVTARVIGASHIISYETENGVLHEMLACVTPPSDLDSFQLRLGDAKKHVVERQNAHFSYSFTSNRIPWRNFISPFSYLVGKANSPESGGFGIAYEFPQGDLAAIPMTVIMGKPSLIGEYASIWSAHSYPGQAVVMSHSAISTVKTQGA
ncbi:MAG: hypothetical protein JWM07_81 [Candidatus Saccharibacteria bacterium]|nr:hypothetical protein [Candidatus Saccharibacteria bacterium]